jgi:hypothetical protein
MSDTRRLAPPSPEQWLHTLEARHPSMTDNRKPDDDLDQAAEDAAYQDALYAAEEDEAAYDAAMREAQQAAYEAEEERLAEERYWERRYDELAERYVRERDE